MYTPASDEKLTMVFAYTPYAMIRGEVVTKQSMLVSRWLRTDGAPKFLHMLNPQVITMGGGSAKSTSYPELFVAVAETLVFHLAPGLEEPLDYEPNERNRLMLDSTLMVGTFIHHGKMRVSAQTDLYSSLESGRTPWASFYEIEVSNPFLPQLHMKVPFLLFRPERVNIAVHE